MGREIPEEEKIGFLKKVLATGCFLGYIPLAPATFSCIISVVIWYFLGPFKIAYIVVTVLLIMTGITVSCDLSRVWGKDPHQIVIDEYASLLIPLYFTPRRIIPLIITVIVFRVFDILKPPPIKQLEKLPSGWGIMSDDLGAAVLTAVVIIILIHVIPL